MAVYDRNTKVYRAGLIPILINQEDFEQSKMMFMIPSANTEFCGIEPQIAKGQIEEDEEPQEAALREANEELGLRIDNIEEIYNCGVWMGRTHIFVACVASDDPSCFDVPQFETEQTVWLTIDEFNKQGRQLHIPVVNSVFDLIYATHFCK